MTASTLVAKYGGRVPRYTSYPTADLFGPAIGPADYADWLGRLPAGGTVSLYLHVPFCDQLCLYCGCNTVAVRGQAPRMGYAAALLREIDLVSAAIGQRLPVATIHWGGGTPTALPAAALRRIAAHLGETFRITSETEIAFEIDPRHLPEDGLDALRDIGVTRVSLGVQDFHPAVQQAIGRVQPLDVVETCVTRLRAVRIGRLSFDLIYGLPFQTTDGVRRTASLAASLGAERLAVFGYAHVPWMKRHQRLLPELALPDAAERFAQREAIDSALQEAGYAPIGLDHYALPGEAMHTAWASGTLRRNFQGYTTDPAPAMIAFGASAIGSLPYGYVQNRHAVPDYLSALRRGELATGRGIALSAEDCWRRARIEDVMCRGDACCEGAPPHAIEDMEADGLIALNGGRLSVLPRGRPFLRSIAALFDAHHDAAAMRHAPAV